MFRGFASQHHWEHSEHSHRPPSSSPTPLIYYGVGAGHTTSTKTAHQQYSSHDPVYNVF